MLWFLKMLFYLRGWKVDRDIPPEARRCVLLCIPHTSNWDFVGALSGMAMLGIRFRFAIKDEWMWFPVGSLLRSIGAIGIDRSPKEPGEDRRSMVDAMADLFENHEELALGITPEGTRSPRKKWRTGFYHIAMKAEVPICLGYLDYDRKVATIMDKVIHPTGNLQEDFREIIKAYQKVTPRHPQNYQLDQVNTGWTDEEVKELMEERRK